MLKKLKSVRVILAVGLVISIAFASYSMYYKIKYWGFNFAPRQGTDVWTIEAHVSFMPNGNPITVSIARPQSTSNYKILDEDVVAKGYIYEKSEKRIDISSKPKIGQQDVYYRVLLYDNIDSKGKTAAEKPLIPEKPILDEAAQAIVNQILDLAKTQSGDEVQQIIRLLNQKSSDQAIYAFMPERRNDNDTVAIIKGLLAEKGISSRVIRGVRLAEDKKSFSSDIMIEAYINNMWKIYNIETGKKGVPKNFVIFQRGGDSLVDVKGGTDSVIKFSIMKSVRSSFRMAGHRAKNSDESSMFFDYSIYSLPLNQQNALKWLMVFPLAMFVVVIMRNVVGISTMGTFTPMLLSMALVEAGFISGLICFTLIITVGLLIRALLSRFNLLLVPRISAVVVFVILIIQIMAILGYRLHWDIASSALFFPIIIMAWIIERASITWEEDGAVNATKEIIYSILVAIITYFVIVNSTIRHIMYAFSELNLVIVFVIMLLGTYTGYRLTELLRFASLVKEKK